MVLGGESNICFHRTAYLILKPEAKEEAYYKIEMGKQFFFKL
jgi:hypothetical protein